jgi:thiamine-phosphate pyrophosphorylase
MPAQGGSMPIGRLHVITDTRAGRDPLPVVRAALDAGAPVVQVRGKELSDGRLYELTCRVLELCASAGATCLVDDRADIAIAAGADGVHVGAQDLPVSAVRRLAPDAVVGATARDPERARALEREGASYLGVGPAYATTSKHGLPATLGAHGVGAVATAVAIPVIAIAGVTAARIPELLAAGAHGVAVIGAISEAADPHAATTELLQALEREASVV